MAEHDVQHDASIIIHTKDSSVANHVDRDDEVRTTPYVVPWVIISSQSKGSSIRRRRCRAY